MFLEKYKLTIGGEIDNIENIIPKIKKVYPFFNLK